jgi:hypothetical protein
MIYTPDGYAILKIQAYGSDDVVLKVFGSWSGGYLDGDSWRLNSGIIDVKEDGNTYLVTGYSGSQYVLSKHTNYIRPYNEAILQDMLAELRSYGHKVELITIKDVIAIVGV